MPERINIVGQRFGRLMVVADRSPEGELLGTPSNRRVIVVCDCGTKKETSARSVRRGHSPSCGCFGDEVRTTHGLSSHPLYAVWGSMKARCYTPSSIMYPRYGARGIQICAEWLDDPVAFVTWALENGYRSGLEIDRINNDGHYEPGNCRFVTGTRNARNKSTNRLVEYRGRKVVLADLAEESGIPYQVLSQRLGRLGWDAEQAATVPVRRSAKASAA